MTDRAAVVKQVKEAKKLPISIPVDNIQKDYTAIYKRLRRAGVSYDVGISKDPFKSLLWFWKRK